MDDALIEKFPVESNKGFLPSIHLPKDDSKGVDICFVIVWESLCYLWCHVSQGTRFSAHRVDFIRAGICILQNP